MSYKEKIARRAAKEIDTGEVVNLGIGIPTLIPNYLSKDRQVIIQSENGILGMGLRCPHGKEDRNLIDAGGNYITTIPGVSFFDSALSFAMIRGGRVDVAFLGALEISEAGDLANWIIPGKYAPGIGGGMELAHKSKRVIVTTSHTTRQGKPKILKQCELPLTAKSCVSTIITELAVIDIINHELVLRELAEETELEKVFTCTGAEIQVPKGEIPRF